MSKDVTKTLVNYLSLYRRSEKLARQPRDTERHQYVRFSETEKAELQSLRSNLKTMRGDQVVDLLIQSRSAVFRLLTDL
jgi:hypothetical protein